MHLVFLAVSKLTRILSLRHSAIYFTLLCSFFFNLFVIFTFIAFLIMESLYIDLLLLRVNSMKLKMMQIAISSRQAA